MAMVFEQKRNLDSIKSENENIILEKYEKSFINGNPFIQNIAPFNISTERILYTEKDNPGPGSYFKNEYNKSSIYTNKIRTIREQISEQFSMYNAMIYLKNKKIKSLKELKIDKNNKSQVQSLNYLNNNNNNEKIKKIHIKILRKEKNNKNDVIIPYLKLENIKESVKTPNISGKKIDKKKKGIIYKYNDLIKMDLQEKTSTNYSTTISNNCKSSQLTLSDENSKILKTNNSSVINLKVDKEGGKSQKLLPKIKSKKFKFIPKLKNWNKIMNNFEENNLINKLRNKFDIDIFASYNNFFDNIPGPGYYSTRSYFDKYKIKSKDYKNNNFWSIQHNNISKKCKKELKKKSKPCLVVENFTKNKTSVPKKSKTKIALKDSMSTNNLIKKLFELNKNETFLKLNNTSTNYVNKLNLGPGQYNIKSQFEQINSKRYSFPLQKRFQNLKGIITPGPGSYLSLENWKKITSNNSYQNAPKINNEELKDNNNVSPDMCTYNPHIVNSIEYKNFAYNSISNSKVPFGSSQKRLSDEVNPNNEIIGPGTYFNNLTDFNLKYNKKRMLYNYTLEKHKTKKEKIKLKYKNNLQLLKDKIGPGSYINNNWIYNGWIKKTFNIKFV